MTYITGSLSFVLTDIDKTILDTRNFALAIKQQMAAGAYSAEDVLHVRQRLIKVRDSLNASKTTPGLAAYAKTEKNNANYDVATEFSSVLAAISAVIANIESTLPANAQGFLLLLKFDATNVTYVTYTTLQTATLQGLLQALADTIS